jgi:hypothetical protein
MYLKRGLKSYQNHDNSAFRSLDAFESKQGLVIKYPSSAL